MSSVHSQDLSRAFELVEQDRLEEARAFIQPLLKDHPDNADLWWIYSHALEDEYDARQALENVLRIDPAYQGASSLYEDLLEVTGAHPPVADAGKQATSKPAISLDEEDEWDEFDLDDEPVERRSTLTKADLDLEGLFTDNERRSAGAAASSTKAPAATQRQALLGLGLAALIVILLLIVFVVINPFGGEEEQPATQSAQVGNVTTEAAGGVTLPTFTPDTGSVIPAITLTDTIEAAPTQDPTETLIAATETPIEAPATATSPPSPTEVDPTATETPTNLPATATPTATPAQADPTETEAPTNTELPSRTPTVSLATEAPAPVSDGSAVSTLTAQVLENAFAEMELVEGSAMLTQTSLGSTLIVSVCTQPGEALRDDIDRAMTLFAREGRAFTREAQAVGVVFVNCDTNRTLNTIAVGLNDAIAFSDGELSQAEFRARWRVIG